MSRKIKTNLLKTVHSKGNESGDLIFFFLTTFLLKLKKETNEHCYHLAVGRQYYLHRYLYCMLVHSTNL